ncbi:MAG: carbamoyltransferase HypF, partial [Candidatus Brocadiae bacterium]|nr:carbamoyltransferase HypF [Candidatus Brocadiia bacterium]
ALRATGDDALRAAAARIAAGGILALKGLGGFQLICDARDPRAVARLRERKGREEKPFAVMTATLESARALCRTTPAEEALLDSPESPIVLLRRRGEGVCAGVAPGTPLLGVLLPTTPLHHLLLRDLGFPVVATSGNLSEEPICTGNEEAFDRLGGVADGFLAHDRPIARHVDDSVVRVIAGRATLLRRARGYAPMPILVGEPLEPVIAAGGQGKNTVGIATSGGVVLSQHIGDLDTVAARETLARTADSLGRLFGFLPRKAACDAHAGYASTAWAGSLGIPVVPVQHHHAHVLSCLAENDAPGPVLGVAWDGAGAGPDGTVWGGEFLRVDGNAWERVAHLRTFPLPGGDRAAREPRRAALGMAFEIFGPDLPPEVARLFSPAELATLLGMLGARVNTPRTSSAGRVFDAVAALAGLRSRAAYEGQAAMELEFAAEESETGDAWPLPLDGPILDWEPLLRALLDDLRAPLPVAVLAARFHNALVDGIAAVARRTGLQSVVLSGGCFQNGVLTGRAVGMLENEGFRVFRHQRVPPNDGGLALGQALAAGR